MKPPTSICGDVFEPEDPALAPSTCVKAPGHADDHRDAQGRWWRQQVADAPPTDAELDTWLATAHLGVAAPLGCHATETIPRLVAEVRRLRGIAASVDERLERI